MCAKPSRESGQWKIPLSDIDMDSEEIDSVVKVLQSKWLSMGPVTHQFERQFSEFLGVKHAFAVSNGTAALHIAMSALGIEQNDEVIVPSLTFVATANCALYVGATPIFADITSSDDLNISPEDIRNKITPKTKAIIVVHYGGYPADMDAIMKIAQENNLFVVEDAAHAPGAELGSRSRKTSGKKLGTIGNIGCFSFFPNKNMTTGEGGMIVTDDDNIAEKIKIIRSHGMTTLTWDRHKGHAFTYDVVDLGYNYRIDEIRSAMGLIQLKKLNENNERRKAIVQLYKKHLESISDINIPFTSQYMEYKGKPSFHIFPILLGKGISRKEFMDKLNEKGIQASIHYPPIHQFTYYKEKYNFTDGMLPKTEFVSRREVTLPLYPTMSDEDVGYVSDVVREIIVKRKT